MTNVLMAFLALKRDLQFFIVIRLNLALWIQPCGENFGAIVKIQFGILDPALRPMPHNLNYLKIINVKSKCKKYIISSFQQAIKVNKICFQTCRVLATSLNLADAKTTSSYFLGSTLAYFWTNFGPIPVELIFEHFFELFSSLFYVLYLAYLGIPIYAIVP